MIKIKRLAVVLLTVFMVTVTTVSVKASSSAQGGVGGYTVYGYSYISATNAYGTTYSATYNPDIYVTVSATYNCVNPLTLDTKTFTGALSGSSSVTKSFTAPDGYRSVSIYCGHSASLNGQTWSATTSATY